MANTFDSALNGTLISQAGLSAFVAAIAPLTRFSTNFDPAPASKSDTIQVPYVPAASAAATFAGTYTRQGTTLEKKTITLNKHKFVSWEVTDLETSKSPVVTLERFGAAKGYQLALAVAQDILSVVTAANYSTAAFVGASSGFDSDDVVDIKSACDTAKMPTQMRSIIMSSAYYNRLLKDSAIKDSGAFGGSEAVRTGVIPNLFGFDLFGSEIIPDNSENLVGMASYPSGIIIANRYLQPNGSTSDGIYNPVSDASGITLGYREFYDNDKGTRIAVLECLYGYAIGEAAALKRMTSA